MSVVVNQELLFFNGIDVTTGAYDRPPMSGAELWRIIKGEESPEDLAELRFRYLGYQSKGRSLLFGGLDPTKLEESGWGVIFASDADPAVKEALSELLKWREKQAGSYYYVYDGSDGHRQGENKTEFLARHGVRPGPAEPAKAPYYLLIVGSPDRIPYSFQTQLDLQYAVGRIHFATLDEYANYARSVVTAESGKVKLPRTGAFFGAANPDDWATSLSAEQLVGPLFEKFSGDSGFRNWEFKTFMREQATRQQLERLIGGDQTPSFLFSATHGASFPAGDSRQRSGNGALVCQDWPGPSEWQQALPEEFYFSGNQISADRNLLGLIAFFFACYGGGTPRMDEFSALAFRDSRRQIAEKAFLAELPTKMLGRPKGGALAVIGLMDRAWGYSFAWPGAGTQLAVFESTIRPLLEGHPVGAAFQFINDRYAELSTVLADAMEDNKLGTNDDASEMVGLWTASQDAQAYAIIGDPAVRLPVAGEYETPAERSEIEVKYAPPADEGVAEPGKEPDELTDGEALSAGDNFAQITGIGEKSQEALWQSGVLTYADLAAADSSDLLTKLRHQGLRVGENTVAGWIDLASSFVCVPIQPEELFAGESTDTKIYVCQTEQQWCLEIDALVVPVDGHGRLGRFARALFARLNEADEKELTAKILARIGDHFSHLNPVRVELSKSVAAQLLSNRPRGENQRYWLIAATAGGAGEITDLRETAEAIVMEAHRAGARKLGVVPMGNSLFPDQVAGIAGQMLHGMRIAQLGLAATSLREIIFAPLEQDALEAVKRKERLLTHNRPQKVESDRPAVKDLLGVKDEVDALAETLMLREVTPPISVAILGGWGSGKSTVMRLMMNRMTQARVSRIGKGWPDAIGVDEEAADDPRVSTRVGHIYQILFNAWTYTKSSLWASLMQTIFLQLNQQLTAEQQLFDEFRRTRGEEDWTPLSAEEAFQFIYPRYIASNWRLWNELDENIQAALQPATGKNELWWRLRAKQKKTLRDLQQREAAIERLKLQRQRLIEERRRAVIQELGQESQAVAYGILRRKSADLLGNLVADTETEIKRQSRLALAKRLRETLDELGKAVSQLSAGDMEGLRAVLNELGTIIDQAPQKPGKPAENAADETSHDGTEEETDEAPGADVIKLWLEALRNSLVKLEAAADRALQSAWTEYYPASVSLLDPLADIKQRAHEASKMTDASQSSEALLTDVRDISTIAKKVRETAKQNWRASVSLGIVGLVLLLATIILLAITPEWINATAAKIGGYVTAIMTALAVFGPPLKVARDWSRRINKMVDEYQEAAEAEHQRYQAQVESRLAAYLAEDEKVLQNKIARAVDEGQQPTSQTFLAEKDQPNLAVIDHLIDQLSHEADELQREAGPPGEYDSLIDFIQSRQDEKSYESRLGLMHQVKRDIDLLTSGLVIEDRDEQEVIEAKRAAFPRGPARVILYIDDLDRCPPKRVVEVLEAVQLLLDTKLFVVVLGLDTRYITRALEKEYKEILQRDGDPSGLDYIEKIVQLPYRVRPIGKKGIADFLKAQMEVVVVQEELVAEEAVRSGDEGGMEITHQPQPVVHPPSSGEVGSAELAVPGGPDDTSADDTVGAGTSDEQGEQEVQGAPVVQGGQEESGEMEVQGEQDGPAHKPGPQPVVVRQQPTKPDGDHGSEEEVPPEVIRFQPADLEDLTTCCQRLKLTPRNVKRLVNVLKLINVYWFRTGDDMRPRPVKRAVMGLLALSAAYPEIMREVFDQMDLCYRKGDTPTTKLVGEYLEVSELPSNQRWREQCETLAERFQSDVDSLYQKDNPAASFISLTMDVLQEDTFNVVRSFSFVGDPVYLSDDGDGQNPSASDEAAGNSAGQTKE